MRLISVKVLNNEGFRSIASNALYMFDLSELDKNQVSTKIFAGVNGSGKSNFLELLSEIFFFLEMYHLPSTKKEYKKGKHIGFEIEYLIPNPHDIVDKLYIDASNDDTIQVRIVKLLGELPEFSIKRVFDEEFRTRVDEETDLLLPRRIVAYTSGQNELLSNAYQKLRYHYFESFQKGNSCDSISDKHRLLYLDSSINHAVFIANMLLADENKLSYILNILKIKKLQSFRITLNEVDINNKPIAFQQQLKENVEKLKKCATTWIKKVDGKRQYHIFDYYVNEATIKAFKHYFGTAFELFKTLYDLEMLNPYLMRSRDRKLMTGVDKSFNFSDDLGKHNPFRLIFRLENILLSKVLEEKTIPIYYKALSDGEHQFNEVIGTILMMDEDGCLFLMDEPDTHFNPKWRAKMVDMINNVSAISFDSNKRPTEVCKQDIIITTHSPFIVSDTKKEDVYIFEKDRNGTSYRKPKVETYGASINLILQEVFSRDITISDYANAEIEELKQQINKAESIDELLDIRESVFKFGESFEKFDLYNFLSIKEEELEGNL